jgi:hypothetical protein
MSAVDTGLNTVEHVTAPVVSAPEIKTPQLDAAAHVVGVIEPIVASAPSKNALQGGITQIATLSEDEYADRLNHFLDQQSMTGVGSGAAVAEEISPDELVRGAQRVQSQTSVDVLSSQNGNGEAGVQQAAKAQSHEKVNPPAESPKLAPEDEAERTRLREAASQNKLTPDEMARLNELNQQEATGAPPDRYDILNKKLAAGETLTAEEQTEWTGLHEQIENQKVIDALADIDMPLTEAVVEQLNERMAVSSKLLVDQITAKGMDIALRIMNRFEPYMFDENRMSAQTKETYRMLAELRLVLLQQEQIRQMLKQVVKQYDRYPPLIEKAETELDAALKDKTENGVPRRDAAILEFNRLHGGLAALRETVAGLARQHDQGSSQAKIKNIMNRVKRNQGLQSFADYFWTNLKTGIKMDFENLANNIDTSFGRLDARVQRGKEIAASG